MADDKDSRSVDVWKYTTAIAVSLLLGIMGGQFLPNRSIVTSDQLAAATLTLREGQSAQQAQIDELGKTVSELTGELRAQHLIAKQP
jgi:hypothetical protein